MEDNNQKKCKTTSEIKCFYFIPTCILCSLIMGSVVTTMVYTWQKAEWFEGVITFLILDALLFGLALTAMIAMYREMSRLHERKTIELEEQNEELKEQNKQLDDLNKGYGKQIEELEKQIKEIKERNNQ